MISDIPILIQMDVEAHGMKKLYRIVEIRKMKRKIRTVIRQKRGILFKGILFVGVSASMKYLKTRIFYIEIDFIKFYRHEAPFTHIYLLVFQLKLLNRLISYCQPMI